MSREKKLVAKNPSEARGIRRALNAMGVKFEHVGASRRRKPKKNPRRRVVTRRMNVDGFVDDGGMFHPIRGTSGYSGAAAGESKRKKRKPAKRRTRKKAKRRK